jgi:hypothetical protein
MRENFMNLKLTVKFEIHRERRGGIELVEGDKTEDIIFKKKLLLSEVKKREGISAILV